MQQLSRSSSKDALAGSLADLRTTISEIHPSGGLSRARTLAQTAQQSHFLAVRLNLLLLNRAIPGVAA